MTKLPILRLNDIKTTMKYLLLVLFSLIILCDLSLAAGEQDLITVKGSPFAIAAKKKTEVTWNGEKLIDGDWHSWIANQDVGSSTDKFEIFRGIGWQYTNVWNEKQPLPWRREIGISPDGKKIELTFQSHQDALMTSYPASMITYKILVPLTALENATWEAMTGRSYNAAWKSGNLSINTPDGDIVGLKARWISFTTPHGKITFDFNPHGLTTYYTASEANAIQSLWSLIKKKDMIEMSFSVPATNYGGALHSKLTIFEGDRNDYLDHHAVDYYHYFSEIPAEQLYCFGGRSPAFVNAGTSGFEPAKGFGWHHPEDLVLSGNHLNGVLYSSVSSTRPNSFETSNLRPGLYIVTIRSAALRKKTGPFTISLNGKEVFQNIRVDSGQVVNLNVVRWIEEGKAELKFEGDWAVSVLGFQLFMHTQEDYSFRRAFWLRNNGFCPDVLYANYFDEPPMYGKSVSYSPLAGQVEDISAIPELPELETALPSNDEEGLLWRYTSPLGTLGPDNYGSFSEFNTPRKIKERLKQIREGGVQAVILNGFLSRHTFPTHLKRVEKNIRKIVKTGHKTGMKFIDHQDLSILWNMDMGFRFLAAHPEYLQRTHTTGLPNWGICPINPLFNEGYFTPYIIDHIRNTRIDGLMVDEVTFHGSNFCNCDHCRESFTKATQLILPDDETNSLLRNRSSKLWKAWIEWRKHAIAQWRIDLSRATHAINDAFSNMQYYSEGGFLRDYASYEQGGDLPLSAKSMDFLGTEIMSRDIWDDYRYTFASRHMYNSLRETYGSPVFGLVYPLDEINYAIMGWAMNNMLGQVTWSLGSIQGEERLNAYSGWKENMNIKTATPVVDMAIIFSRRTRDWATDNTIYPQELMGTSQMLSEHHIQHTFILDDALLNQDLSRFRILLAPGMDCVSDEQLIRLKEYVINGGTLYLTGDALKYTSFGELRDAPTFGTTFPEINTEADWVETTLGSGRIIYSRHRYGINDFCTSFTIGNIYQYTPNAGLTALHEKNISMVTGNTLSFQALSIPPKVLTSVYVDFKEGKKVTMVHLLNATGVKIKNGDKLPLPDPTFEKISEDLIFELSAPVISSIYYASPDTPGHQTVRAEKTGDGRFRITVPAGTVDKYGIVYITH